MADTADPNLHRADLVLTATPIYIGIALVLFVVLWPTRREARKILTRWGVSEPSELEVAEALRCLKHRRLAYLVLYLAITIGSSRSELLPMTTVVLVVLFVGGIAADLPVWRRPASVDSTPAAWPPGRALIPRWSLMLASTLFGALAMVSGVALLGQAWALRVVPHPVPALIGTSAAAAFSAVALCSSLRRPAAGTSRVHQALRLRSARVAVALTMLTPAGVTSHYGAPVTAWTFAMAGLAGAIATTTRARDRRPDERPAEAASR